MKKFRITTLILFSTLYLFNIRPSYSSHLMGADITWQCVGQDSFIVKLSLYRDCNGTNMTATANITFKCKSTGTTIVTKSVSRPAPRDITPTCEETCTRCNNGACTFQYGIQQFIYQTGIVNLSNAGSCCNIVMSYNECCRNNAITTGPSGNLYVDAMLNRCLTPCDNSPIFTNSPVALICVGQDFTFNHSVMDVDMNSSGGQIDSLTYSWTRPLNNANSPSTYSSPYSYDKPIWFWGFPYDNLPYPRGFHLDPNTGDITFRPMKIQVTVMAIEVKEYRGGEHIGSIRRDIQIIVINCPSNNPPVVSGPYYKEVCAGSTVQFTFATNDYDPSDSLLINWSNNLQGATWTDNNRLVKRPTGSLSWTPGENQSSSIPYTFTVTVNDDACPVEGRTTRAYQILVKRPPPKANISYFNSCENYTFSAGQSRNDITYLWSGSDGLSSHDSVFSHQFSNPGYKSYTLVLTDPHSCVKNSLFSGGLYVDSIFKASILENDTDLCMGDQITLHANYLGSSGSVNIQWSTDQNDTLHTKTLIADRDTFIKVNLMDTNGCTASDSIYINVHNYPIVNLGADFDMCYGNNVALAPQYQIDDSYLNSINWYSNTGSLITNDTALTVTDSGLYICEVADAVGCKSRDSIYVTAYHPNTNLGNDITLCSEDTAYFDAGSGFVTYNWSSGDTTQTISYPYFGTVTTTLIVEVTDSFGCLAKDSVVITRDTDCVWPGDANSDGVANMLDILNIGVAYNSTGPLRQNASLLWDGQTALNWVNTFSHGINYKHSDCNGNGTIDLYDLSAIILNYGKTYTRTGNDSRDTDPVLQIDVPELVSKTDIVSCQIKFGTLTNPVSNFYAIAFSIEFDGELIDSSTITLDFNNSWIGTNGVDMLTFYKIFDNSIDVAVTRIDQQNIFSGFGKIGTFNFKLKESVVGETEIIIAANYVKAISNDETEIPVFTMSDTGMVHTPVGVKNYDHNFKEFVSVYPNPTKDKVFINSKYSKMGSINILLVDALGTEMANYKLKDDNALSSYEIDLSEYSDGIYYIIITSNKGHATYKLIKN